MQIKDELSPKGGHVELRVVCPIGRRKLLKGHVFRSVQARHIPGGYGLKKSPLSYPMDVRSMDCYYAQKSTTPQEET